MKFQQFIRIPNMRKVGSFVTWAIALIIYTCICYIYVDNLRSFLFTE